ncbi:hypothetical protein RJ639_038242 [Escallonia herrerae]|uniref:Uncharacterized protein n=1 Tax=Escallonia herrerae TaxID=1293975 RepID=A0AA88WQX3_9ASTE|nr:hypothetical protein RJ639_038242 [Escallonia herrerae]
MLPILRRDLIMLENQRLPLFLLSKIFKLTSNSSSTTLSSFLKEHALQFFNPLMSRNVDTLIANQIVSAAPGESNVAIVPRIVSRGMEPNMFKSMTELKEFGVAKLINRLCKGVARDVEESYLHKMVWKINCHCNDWLITKRARLKHDYFSNPWASISTLAAMLLLYLTVLQTSCGLGDARAYLEKDGFWLSIKDCFFIPFSGLLWSSGPSKSSVIWEDGFEDYQYIVAL